MLQAVCRYRSLECRFINCKNIKILGLYVHPGLIQFDISLGNIYNLNLINSMTYAISFSDWLSRKTQGALIRCHSCTHVLTVTSSIAQTFWESWVSDLSDLTIIIIEGQITDFFFVHIPKNHKKKSQKSQKNHKITRKIARKIMKIT